MREKSLSGRRYLAVRAAFQVVDRRGHLSDGGAQSSRPRHPPCSARQRSLKEVSGAMIEHLPSRNLRVAVVGGGFSGAVFAVQLARKATVGVAIDIIEPRTLLGAGVAYSTTDPSHRINVPATKMSVFRDAPAHFAEWLQKDTELASDPAASWPTGQAYPRRVVFGRYVASLVESARRMRPDVTIHHVRETVGGIERRDGGYAVQLVAGGTCFADVVVLAASHPPASVPRMISAALGNDPAVIRDQWADGWTGISHDSNVLIVGTALSMADAVASLDHSGHTGLITAFSRRGLLSRGHADPLMPSFEHFARVAAPDTARGLSGEVRAALGAAQSVGLPWQAVFDDVRAHAPRLWSALSLAERRRFLRHLRVWWDVHRYRLAPQVEAVIRRKRKDGSLEVLGASLTGVRRGEDRIEVTLRPRSAPRGTEIHRAVDVIVIATGPAHAAAIEQNPALAALARQGLIRADPTDLGLDVDGRSRALGLDGLPNPTLLVVGPLARARLGELMGLPQVSEHAEEVAAQVADWLEKAPERSG